MESAGIRLRYNDRIVLTEEAALTGGTLLIEIVLSAETAPATSKNQGEKWESPLSRESIEPAPAVGHWNGKVKKAQASDEDDLAVLVERRAMPTWCHMFNSTLIGAARVWFDELPPESIDVYKDLKAAFLAYFIQQKKYFKDPVEIHNIKQRDGETIEEFMERFKVETGRMKGALESMGLNNPLHPFYPIFLRILCMGFNKPWNRQNALNEMSQRNMEERNDRHHCLYTRRGRRCWQKEMSRIMESTGPVKAARFKAEVDFRGQPREGRGPSRFTPLTRTPKEILAAEARRFKPPPPMVTPVEKRSINKFCDFHHDKGHSTDECMQLKKQIEELVRAGKLSHLIKEIKQGRKKEVPAKDKPMAIYMIQLWHRMTRQKVTQSFKRVSEITFLSLTTSSRTERPLVIEAEIGGHMIHRMYVDGGSSTEVLYEHCFNRLRSKIKNQMVPATKSLTVLVEKKPNMAVVATT
ncbi:reverse transcriptase domain-containing protein [Tanacetum coccineum]